MSEYVFESSYTLFYNTPAPVPLREVIESLQGLEKLIGTTPKVLKKLTGLKKLKLRIEVEEVKTGSLFERILVRCIFGSEEDLNKFLDKVRAVIPPKLLATALIASLLAYGAFLLSNPSATSSVVVGDITNSVVNIGGSQQIPDPVARAIIDSVNNKKEVAGAVIDVTAPARNQPGSSLRVMDTPIDGATSGFELPAALIKNIPNELPNEPLETTVPLTKVVVDIRATDLDNRERGWEGRINGLTGRIKIEFDESVDIADIDRRKTFEADVLLTSRLRSGSSEPKPYSMFIESVYPSRSLSSN